MKTLKDLWEHTETNNHSYTGLEVHELRKQDYNQVRQEAIKRVKSLNTGGFTFKFDYEGKVKQYFYTKKELQTLDYVNLGGIIEFINFFNISEEELK